jgi:uncharacterized protein YdhG (YjbR/CyaY superfamily)
MSKFASVEDYRAALQPEQLAIVDHLRAAASASAPDVTEHIKWNAPSFCLQGDDRITLGTSPKGAVRVVLHRGVKVKDNTDFAFEAPAALVKWAAPDRGVIEFKTEADVDNWAADIDDIFKRWMEMTN